MKEKKTPVERHTHCKTVSNFLNEYAKNSSKATVISERFCENDNFFEIELDFNKFKCDFLYSQDTAFGFSFLEYSPQPATLFVKFKFIDDGMYYDAYDILNLTKTDSFKTLLFHEKFSEQSIIEKLNLMTDFIENHYGLLSALEQNKRLYNELYRNKIFDFKTAVSDKDSDFKEFLNSPTKDTAKMYLDTLNNFYAFAVTEENTKNYKSFIAKGENKKAVQILEKEKDKNTLTVFELNFLKHLKENDFYIDEETKEYAEKEIKAKEKQGIYFLFSLVISTALWFGFSKLFAFLGAEFVFKDTMIISNAGISFFLSLLASISTVIPIFKLLVKVTNKEIYDQMAELTGINKKPYNILPKLAIPVAILIFAANFYIGGCGLAIKDDKIIRHDMWTFSVQSENMNNYDFYIVDGYLDKTDSFVERKSVVVMDRQSNTFWQTNYEDNKKINEIVEQIENNGIELKNIQTAEKLSEK